MAADYDYGRSKKKQKNVSIAPHDFKSASDMGVRNNGPYADNAMQDPSTLTETDEDILNKFHAFLQRGNVTDDQILSGVRLTDAGYRKAARHLGIEDHEVELLLRSLVTKLRDEKTRVAEMMEELRGGNPRFSYETDLMKNVTIRDGQTGKKVFLRGTEAVACLNRLKGAEDEQTVLGSYQNWMVENASDERRHADALEKTGFWGAKGAGCVVLAKSTGRILIAHRSEDVEQPHTWGGWGGAIDSGLDPQEAMLAELGQETQFHGEVLAVIPLYVFKKESFRYFNFLVVVEDEFEPRLNWENQGYKWCTFGNWPSPIHFGLKALFSDVESVKKIKAAISRLEESTGKYRDDVHYYGINDDPGSRETAKHHSEWTPEKREGERKAAEDRVKQKRAARAKTVSESVALAEENFDDEVRSNVGSYNFPWRASGQHGYATARFKGRGREMEITVVSIRDNEGERLDHVDHALREHIHQQAIDFIGEV